MSDVRWATSDDARAQLGRVGVWLGALGVEPWERARAAARRIEELGYSALWLSDTPVGKEPIAHAGLLLAATERITIATGIANVWARDATASRNAALALAEAHPGRFTLGLGVSHAPAVALRGHEYGRPLTTMRAYLDGLDVAPYRPPAPARPVPLVLAALRPKMLRLAGERTAGAHPYFTPVQHTARAREQLGAGPLLAPEVSVAVDGDVGRGRRFTKHYLQLPNYVNNLRDLGFGDDDVADDGSDRLVEAIVGLGDLGAVATRIHDHLDAGADHVCVQPVATDLDGALDELERLAPKVL